jgi:FKBP-type peptidyl-prolyl cis-trans isomerase SlyD
MILSPGTVSEHMVVSIHYTLTGDAGNVLDSSAGREPLMYLHGAGNIVPGLEKQLAGRSVGDKLTVNVPPAEGYGERQGPGPQPVERGAFPQGMEVAPGMAFMAQSPDGHPFQLWVVDVQGDQVMVDVEHPLVGQTLHFAVEVVAVREATPQEKEHGHPHGLGGHEHH